MAAELPAETARAAREQADSVARIVRMIRFLLRKRRRSAHESARDAAALTWLAPRLDAAGHALAATLTSKPGESPFQSLLRQTDDTLRALNRIRTDKAREGRRTKTRRVFQQRKADLCAEWLAGPPRTKTAGVEQLHQKHGLSFSTAKKTLASVPFPSHWPARFQR